MKASEFNAALRSTKMDPEGAAARAARLVLVQGYSRGTAAIEIGVDQAAVSRAVRRLSPKAPCPHCAGTGYIPSAAG